MICFTNFKLTARCLVNPEALIILGHVILEPPKKYVSQESKIKYTLIVVLIKVIYYCIFGPVWVKFVFKY